MRQYEKKKNKIKSTFYYMIVFFVCYQYSIHYLFNNLNILLIMPIIIYNL